MEANEQLTCSKAPLRRTTHITIHEYVDQPNEPEVSHVLAQTRQDSIGTVESDGLPEVTNTHPAAYSAPSINHPEGLQENIEGDINSSRAIRSNASSSYQKSLKEANGASPENDNIPGRGLLETPVENNASLDAVSLEPPQVDGYSSQTEQHVRSETSSRVSSQLELHPIENISVADIEALGHIVLTLAHELDNLTTTPLQYESRYGSDANFSNSSSPSRPLSRTETEPEIDVAAQNLSRSNPSVPRATSFGHQAPASYSTSFDDSDSRSNVTGDLAQTPTWQCLECCSQNCATRTIIDTVSVKTQSSRLIRTTTICRECHTQVQFRSCLRCSALNHGKRTVCFRCSSSLAGNTDSTIMTPHKTKIEWRCDTCDFNNLASNIVCADCSTRDPGRDIRSETTSNSSSLKPHSSIAYGSLREKGLTGSQKGIRKTELEKQNAEPPSSIACLVNDNPIEKRLLPHQRRTWRKRLQQERNGKEKPQSEQLQSHIRWQNRGL